MPNEFNEHLHVVSLLTRRLVVVFVVPGQLGISYSLPMSGSVVVCAPSRIPIFYHISDVTLLLARVANSTDLNIDGEEA